MIGHQQMGAFDSAFQTSDHRRMAMTATSGIDRRASRGESLDAAACLFHGFSDPSRIAILRHLLLGEHRVTDLTAHLGLAQSTVSKHLACLKDCGLVTSRPEGRASMFSLTHPEALNELFAAAERLLVLTGDAVALCANYGTDTLPREAR
jgi:DNA-binding transcriptional ArsR family regulator